MATRLTQTLAILITASLSTPSLGQNPSQVNPPRSTNAAPPKLNFVESRYLQPGTNVPRYPEDHIWEVVGEIEGIQYVTDRVTVFYEIDKKLIPVGAVRVGTEITLDHIHTAGGRTYYSVPLTVPPLIEVPNNYLVQTSELRRGKRVPKIGWIDGFFIRAKSKTDASERRRALQSMGG